MGNAIEYECSRENGGCTYWEAMHGINGYNFKDEKYKKCSHCTRPMRKEAYVEHWEKRKKEG